MYRVYKIINNVNDKVYIGITCQTLNQRLRKHLEDKRKGKHTQALYNAMQKYPDASWSIHLIEDNIKDEDIDSKERYYIQLYDSYNNGYNCTIGGRILLNRDNPSSDKTIYHFVNKHTGIKESLTVSEFYHKYDLRSDTVWNFIKGKTKEMTDWYLEERGLKPIKQPKYKTKAIPKIYTLYHDTYGCFMGTLQEFKERFGFHGTRTAFNSQFCTLIKGVYKNMKGWRTTKEKQERRTYKGINNPNYRHGRNVKTT